jgi:hypothetical protein
LEEKRIFFKNLPYSGTRAAFDRLCHSSFAGFPQGHSFRSERLRPNETRIYSYGDDTKASFSKVTFASLVFLKASPVLQTGEAFFVEIPSPIGFF